MGLPADRRTVPRPPADRLARSLLLPALLLALGATAQNLPPRSQWHASSSS